MLAETSEKGRVGTMNDRVWLARLLSVGGVLESVAGMALLVDPSGAASILLGSSLDMAGVVVGRLGGGGLVALGIACWLARNTPTAPASLGVSWAFLAYNVVAGVTLAWATVAIGRDALPALAAAVLHGALGAALLAVLLGRGRSTPSPASTAAPPAWRG